LHESGRADAVHQRRMVRGHRRAGQKQKECRPQGFTSAPYGIPWHKALPTAVQIRRGPGQS
jgi:hypothetical protein